MIIEEFYKLGAAINKNILQMSFKHFYFTIKALMFFRMQY